MRSPVKVRSHALSDIGKEREINEDDFLILEDQGIFALADGMGGHANGEIASRICIEALREAHGNDDFRSTIWNRHRRLRQESRGTRPFGEYELKSAIEYANYAIWRSAERDSRYAGMGTTVVELHLVGWRAYIGWVGDSRLYLLRGDKLHQLTEDHSLANEYVKLDLLHPKDVPRFPYRNVIVRALGLESEVTVDTMWRNCRHGDRILLCTDGLSDLLEGGELAAILRKAASPQTANETLVAKALDRGGHDNVTALSVWLDEEPG